MYPTVTVAHFASASTVADDADLKIYEFDHHLTADAPTAFCTGGTMPGTYYAPFEEVLAA